MIYKLSGVGRIITGCTPSTKKEDYYSNYGYPFITPAEVKNTRFCRTPARCVSEKAYYDYSKRFINARSVLVDCIGSDMGNACLSTEICLTNQQINTITDIRSEIILPEFLYYQLSTMKEYFHSIGMNGSTMPIISKSLFENIEIDIPDIDFQHHIVDILGSIDNSIENNEEEIKKINDFALLLISQTDNKKTALKPYIKFIKGKKPVQNGTEKADYLSIEGISSSVYEQAYVDGMVMAAAFDILMVMDGASSGTVYSHQSGIVSSTLAKIDTPADMNDYIYWFLLSMKDTIKSRNTGSAIPHANKDYISSLMIDTDIATNVSVREKLHTIRERIIALNAENIKLRELKHLYLKKFFG